MQYALKILQDHKRILDDAAAGWQVSGFEEARKRYEKRKADIEKAIELIQNKQA